ncbi:MAG: major capsid protein [candidate division WOR-3 bacterium]
MNREEILSLLEPNAINDVLVEIKTKETILYSNVFANQYMSPTRHVRISDITISRKALPISKPETPSPEYREEEYNVKTFEIPLIKVKRFLSPSEIRDLSKLQGSDITTTLANYLAVLKKQLIETYEILCAKALSGQIIHRLFGNGDIVISFGNIQNYTVANYWNDANGKPIDDINSMIELIVSKTNHGDFVLVVSQSVINALINNSQTKEYLAHTIGDQVYENGRITRIADVDIAVVRGTYTDADDNVKSLLPNPKEVYLVSRTALYKVFGPPESFDLAGPTEAYAYTSYKELDPMGIEIGVMARFLPLILDTNAIVKAQVLP